MTKAIPSGDLATPSKVRSGKSVVASTLGVSLLAAGVGFIVNILMARTLGPHARGEVALALQLGYFASLLLTLGRERARLREGRDYDERLLGATCVLFVSLAVATPPASWILAPIALTAAHIALRRSIAVRTGSLRLFARDAALLQSTVLVGCVCLSAVHARSPLLWLLPYSLPALLIALREVVLRRSGKRFATPNLATIAFLPGSLAAMLVLRCERILMPAAGVPLQDLGVYVAVATAVEPVAWLAQAVADRRVSAAAVPTRVGEYLRRATVDLLIFGGISAVGGVLVRWAFLPMLGAPFSDHGWLVAPIVLATALLAVYRQFTGWLTATSPTLYSVCEGSVACVAVITYLLAAQFGGMKAVVFASIGIYFGACLAAVLLLAVAHHRSRSRRDGM